MAEPPALAIIDGQRIDSIRRQYEQGELQSSGADPSLIRIPVTYLNSRVHLWRGDISRLSVDTLVIPAQEGIVRGGEEVNLRVHDAAGERLDQQCRREGAFWERNVIDDRVGVVCITDADMPNVKSIVHAVAPKYKRRNRHTIARAKKSLRDQYQLCMLAAMRDPKAARTIAISTLGLGGRYPFPLALSVEIGLGAVRHVMQGTKFFNHALNNVVFCVPEYDNNLWEEYRSRIVRIFPPTRIIPPDTAIKPNQEDAMSSVKQPKQAILTKI